MSPKVQITKQLQIFSLQEQIQLQFWHDTGFPPFICMCCSHRVQRLSLNFTPRTLAGPKDSSLPPKLWAGAPPSCCKHRYKHIILLVLWYFCSESQTIWWTCSCVVRDSADRVVGENGTYEELIASSHEIAGSTAQLVAASKVQTGVRVFSWSRPITSNGASSNKWSNKHVSVD